MSSGSFGLLLSTQVSVSEGGTLLQFLFLCVFCFFFFLPPSFQTLPKESEVTQCGRWKKMLLGKRLETQQEPRLELPSHSDWSRSSHRIPRFYDSLI